MPNITVYVDDVAYIDFLKLEKDIRMELRNEIKAIFKRKINQRRKDQEEDAA